MVRTPLTVCQNLSSSVCNHIHGSPVWWSGPNGPWLYVWAENDFLRAFRFDTSTQRFDCRGAAAPLCNPVSVSNTTSPEGVPGGSQGMPGGMLSISANGSAAGSGIVWASHPWTGNGNQQVVDGVLRAYDAGDLTRELWNSKQNAASDDVGPFAKFAAPTVTGGQVFLPTFSGLWGKTTLNETSANGPALGRLGDTLMVGWTGTDGHLNVVSTSDGFNYGTKATLGDTSNFAPAMASGSNSVFLAWTGTDGHLNVMRSTSLTFAGATRLAETGGAIPLVETSDSAPALSNANGRIVLAWKGNGNGNINVMSSPDGVTFDSATKVTLGG